MSAALADLLFQPQSVVVYGASSDPTKLSGRPLDYLQNYGYKGAVFAVNPRRTSVQGVDSYASIADVPGPVDLAIIVVPAPSVVDAVRQCAEAHVSAAIVFASGFGEVDSEGEALQRELADAAATTGMRVIGPNCLGTFATPTRAFATFSTAFDEGAGVLPDSPIAFVAQSGAVGTFTYSMMTTLGIGVRYFANTGNSCDVTTAEVLASLVHAPDVDVLLGHIEDGSDIDEIERVAAAAEAAGKSLVLLKGGRTSAGARAVNAHTGSVAGDDARLNEVLAGHGAFRVEGMDELADAALALASGRRANGRRLTVITQSGGAGALASDVAVDEGLLVEPWSADEDRVRLDAILPYFASTANPMDCTGALINDVTLLEQTLDVVSKNEDTDAVLVVLGNSDRGAAQMVSALKQAYAQTEKPFFVSWTGGGGQPRMDLLKAGVPTYTEPARAVRAMARLCPASPQ